MTSGWTSTSVPYITPGSKDVWAEEAAARGGKGSQRIAYAGETVAPADIAHLLGLGDDGAAIVRRRVIYLDERPIELTDSYYPPAIAAGTALATPAKIRGGAVTLLAELGHAGAHVQEEVTARPPTPEERDLFALTETEPVLTLTRLIRDDADRPVQADVMVTPARSTRLRYELKVTQ
ncbi:UTRA domain-containing protein [Actinocorallia sp. API 0066]|uniref:GntR family transcriptional regulator n=1 Tax=Actinocorallia sp. API 0066 TaxID=2896846 RepID=UPI001E32689B|nr:UTRA domain-containing protein [Actinocorallia sp. API 0066]MCD0447605.1 UTRA domain-containing protein [Actinocorallia sp. API 0066]